MKSFKILPKYKHLWSRAAELGNSAPTLLINQKFYQLSIEATILKIRQYLIDLANYNDFFKNVSSFSKIAILQSYKTFRIDANLLAKKFAIEGIMVKLEFDLELIQNKSQVQLCAQIFEIHCTFTTQYYPYGTLIL